MIMLESLRVQVWCTLTALPLEYCRLGVVSLAAAAIVRSAGTLVIIYLGGHILHAMVRMIISPSRKRSAPPVHMNTPSSTTSAHQQPDPNSGNSSSVVSAASRRPITRSSTAATPVRLPVTAAIPAPTVTVSSPHSPRAATESCSSSALVSSIINLVLACCAIAAPMVCYQLYSQHRYCTPYLASGYHYPAPVRYALHVLAVVRGYTPSASSSTDGVPVILTALPAYCTDWLPDVYGHVQRVYWNVGLFRYYELKQLPNFALAGPVLLLAAYTVYRTVRVDPLSFATAGLVKSVRASAGAGAVVKADADRPVIVLPFMYHLLVLLLISISVLHGMRVTCIALVLLCFSYWSPLFCPRCSASGYSLSGCVSSSVLAASCA